MTTDTEWVMVPRAIIEKLIDPRLDAERDDSRLYLRAQNPGNNFHWTRNVSRELLAGDIKKLTHCLSASPPSPRVGGEVLKVPCEHCQRITTVPKESLSALKGDGQ